MKQKRFLFLLLSISGIILLLLANFVFTSDKLKVFNGLSNGFGSAMLVLGIGNLINSFIVPKLENEKLKQLKSIEVKDERNIRIKEKSSYMTMKVMNYIIFVLTFVLIFMKVDKIFLFIWILLLLTEFILIILFSNYYSKKM